MTSRAVWVSTRPAVHGWDRAAWAERGSCRLPVRCWYSVSSAIELQSGVIGSDGGGRGDRGQFLGKLGQTDISNIFQQMPTKSLLEIRKDVVYFTFLLAHYDSTCFRSNAIFDNNAVWVRYF